MKEKEIAKPFVVILDDAKEEIVKSINKIANDNNLSYFMLNLIINDIHQEIQIKQEQERKIARENYEKLIKNQERKSDKND